MKRSHILCCVNVLFRMDPDGVLRIEFHKDDKIEAKVLADEVRELTRWLSGFSKETICDQGPKQTGASVRPLAEQSTDIKPAPTDPSTVKTEVKHDRTVR